MSAHFSRHENHEVAKNLSDAKQIAHGQAENNRYPHRATAILLGNAALRPYDAVYLDGLPSGMSGYWTVLSVTHILGYEAHTIVEQVLPDMSISNTSMIFNGNTPYVMQVSLGCDELGKTVEVPQTRGYRNIEFEMSGAAQVEASHSKLINESALLGLSVPNPHGETLASTATTTPTIAAPNFSIMTMPQRWEGTRGD